MSNTKIFPPPDAEFNTYANTAVPYMAVAATKTRLAISTGNISAAGAILTDWNAVFPDSQDDNRRTRTITRKKNKVRRALEGQFRIIYADIPESALTDEDRSTLRLKERDGTRTPVPAPDTVPDIFITPLNGTRLRINAKQQPAKDGSAKRGKPEGVGSFEIVWKVGEPPPENGDDCASRMIIGKNSATLQLDGADRAKIITLFVRWISTSNKPGPWCNPETDIVPK